ncbi:tetratricopeptide repeat protein [Vibrio gallaecicus]|uniref:Tetratricopeptide repeat protein n=1 Tax=Vibrio gallaecicus TaxID=552386 RepID=A0ABV4NGT7_9VIBR
MKKLALLWLALVSYITHAEVDIKTFERYQKLSHFLERDSISIDSFARFHDNHQAANSETKELTKSLYLQACLKLEMVRCALDRTNELLKITENLANKEQLLRLSVQLNYQNQRYFDALDRFNTWRDLHVSESVALKPTLTTSQTAAIYTIAGHSAYHIEQWQQTVMIMKEAIRLDATQQHYQLLLASYQRLEAFGKERALLLKVTALYPNQDKYWSRLAQSSVQHGEKRQAITALSVVNNLGKLSEQQRILLAQLQLGTDTPALAYQTLNGYTPSAEYKDKANTLKLHALLRSRQQHEAMQLLESLASQSSLATRAQLAYAEQRWEQAIPLINKLLTLEPKNKRWQLLQAIAHFELHQYNEAKPLLTSLVGGKFDNSAKQWLAQIAYLDDAQQ